jgi:hypothetical protein
MGGCSGGSSITSPLPEGQVFNFMMAPEMQREAEGYYEVTQAFLGFIKYQVLGWDGKNLDASITFNNPTPYNPRNFQMIFDNELAVPEAMSECGWGSPNDCIWFNDGNAVQTGVPYVEYVSIEVTKFPIDAYVYGLFGYDPLNPELIYRHSNDLINWSNQDIYLTDMAGNSLDTDLDGMFCFKSAGGRMVASIRGNVLSETWLDIKNMDTGNVITVESPNVDDCAITAIVWGCFDYTGNILYAEVDCAPNKAYIMKIDPHTGAWEWVEGSDDGSHKVMAGNCVMGPNGEWLYYAKSVHPVGYPPNPLNLFRYNGVVTEQLTDLPTPQLPYLPHEIYPCTASWDGERILYREAYLEPTSEGGGQYSYTSVFDLKVLDISTGDTKMLMEGTGDDYIYEAVFGWEGKYCYVNYWPEVYGNSAQIIQIDMDTLEQTIIMDEGLFYEHLGISGDGRYLYGGSYSVGYASHGIWYYTLADSTGGTIDGVGSKPNNGV